MSLAPQAIRIRYGNSGLLGAAVAAAAANGGGANPAGQARDNAFISQMLDYQQSQQRDVANINPNQLQQAYANRGPQFDPQQQTASDTALKNAYLSGAAPDLGAQAATLNPLLQDRNVSPDEFKNVLASNVANQQKRNVTAKQAEAMSQKKAYLSSAARGLNEEDNASLAAMAESPDATVAQLRVAVAQAQKKAKNETDNTKEVANKQAFLNSVANNLKGPGHAEGLAALAGDPRTSLAQVQAAYSELKGRERQSGKDNLTLQAQGIDHEAQAVATMMSRIAGELKAAGIDPDVAKPADFNPQVADPNKSTFNTMGVWDSIKDNAMIPGTGNLVTPNANAGQFKAYAAYQQMKTHLNKLLLARKALVSDDASIDAGKPTAAAASDPLGIR